MIHIGISGVNGKMGRSVIESVLQQKDMVISAALARKGNSNLGKTLGQFVHNESLDVPITEELSSANAVDVLIDFTLPEGTLDLLQQCLSLKIPMVIGTTGFNQSQWDKLKQASTTIPILQAPNMSLGVNVCYSLAKQAVSQLSSYEDKDIAIIETHHKHKKDAPSGTALALGDVIQEAGYQKDIQYHSVRAGEVIGEHTLVLSLGGERIELTHRASDRRNFSDGAVCAARWLVKQPSGFYTMQDVL